MTERNLPTIAEIEKMDFVNLQLLDVDVLEALAAELDERAKAILHEKKVLGQVISDLLENYAAASFKSEEKDTGTVTFLRDEREIKATRMKEVSWDQSILADLWNRISAADENPTLYMVRSEPSYTVPEAIYKNFSPEIKAEFDAARTVKPSATKFKIVPKKES